VPLSTLPNWERELAKWAPQMYTVTLKGNLASRKTIIKYDCFLGHADGSKRKRGRPTRFSVLLTTYEVAQQVLLSCPLCMLRHALHCHQVDLGRDIAAAHLHGAQVIRAQHVGSPYGLLRQTCRLRRRRPS
jgi:SNF2 family DNA or RNA helicase